jgi:hypothetical protein
VHKPADELNPEFGDILPALAEVTENPFYDVDATRRMTVLDHPPNNGTASREYPARTF